MDKRLSLTYYSDVLCVWAHIAQARVDEVKRRFADRITINYRFCSVFGDTAHKIGAGWKDRGGYAGFADHVQSSVADFDHVSAHAEIWRVTRPASSTPAHLVVKAVQRVDATSCEAVLKQLRRAFFENAQDVAQWATLVQVLDSANVSVEAVRDQIDSGAAFADLEADNRDRQALMVQGSPTFILSEGRQKLYGNVGYGVIEANIKELLRSPTAGAASWC